MMNKLIIRTNQLHYRYGRQPAIEALDLKVPAGAIYGFLGPNGAGKSTAIKLLLGLLRPAAGEVELFGQSIRTHRRAILRRVGALIEAPALYGELSARDNLRWLDRLFHMGAERIEEVLRLVDLEKAAGKKVKKFSMGMKQRLGIGMALFHDPDLLILDEPVNGLDPAGIQEMRRLFQRLRAAGKTLLISSHILAEVEKVATHIGIIQEGKLRFQGPITELRAATRPRVRLWTNDNIQATAILRAAAWEVQPAAPEGVFVSTKTGPQFHRLLKTLMDHGFEIYRAERTEGTLEDLFFELTADKPLIASSALP